MHLCGQSHRGTRDPVSEASDWTVPRRPSDSARCERRSFPERITRARCDFSGLQLVILSPFRSAILGARCDFWGLQVPFRSRIRGARCDFCGLQVVILVFFGAGLSIRGKIKFYGSCSGLVDENHPFSPSTPYATSRAACDMHLLNFFKNYNFPVVFTRAANVYGPGQQLYRIIPRTILFIKLGKKLQLHGGGKSLRSFIHIRDVAEATLDEGTLNLLETE